MDSGFPWWILLIVVVLGIFVYLMLMLFLPEWVGITGKTAIENEKSHLEGSVVHEEPPKGRMRTMSQPMTPPPMPVKNEASLSPESSSHPVTPLTTSTSKPPTLTIVKKSEGSSNSED